MVTASHKHNTVNNYCDEVWPLLIDAMFNNHIRYPGVRFENGVELRKQIVSHKKLLHYLYNDTNCVKKST
jgi:hypothetical protein